MSIASLGYGSANGVSTLGYGEGAVTPPPPPAIVNPTPLIEIAFTTDPGAAPVWVDVTQYVFSLTTHRGRATELDRFDAGTVTVELNNNDRRFDPTNTAGPYYPNLLPMRRIRVSAVWNAVTYRAITAFIDAWPVKYPGPRESTVSVAATDGFKVLALADVVLVTVPEESSSARVNRVLDMIGWPAADRAISAGASVLPAVPVDPATGYAITGTKALAYLQTIEQSENGRLWMRADGAVVFQSRWDLGLPPYTVSQCTFGDGGGTELPYPNVVPMLDETFLWNDVRLTGDRAGAVEQVAADAASQNRYLRRSLTLSGLLVTDNELSDAAQYRLTRYKDPVLRFEALNLEGRGNPALLWPHLLGREITDRVTVRRRPPGGGTLIDQAEFIEGIEQTWTRDLWQTVFHLSPAGLSYAIYPAGKGFFKIGDATYGKLDTGSGVLVY